MPSALHTYLILIIGMTVKTCRYELFRFIGLSPYIS